MATTAPVCAISPGSIVDVRAWWSRKNVRCKVSYALNERQIAVTPADGSYTRIVNTADVQVIKTAPTVGEPAAAHSAGR